MTQPKWCSCCKKHKPGEQFFKNKTRWNKLRSSCRECDRKRDILKHLRATNQAIMAYGGQCVCCGERRLTFLELDHIHNDGYLYRKTANNVQQLRRLKKAGWPPDVIQVLCGNCHNEKTKEGHCSCQSYMSLILDN